MSVEAPSPPEQVRTNAVHRFAAVPRSIATAVAYAATIILGGQSIKSEAEKRLDPGIPVHVAMETLYGRQVQAPIPCNALPAGFVLLDTVRPDMPTTPLFIFVHHADKTVTQEQVEFLIGPTGPSMRIEEKVHGTENQFLGRRASEHLHRIETTGDGIVLRSNTPGLQGKSFSIFWNDLGDVVCTLRTSDKAALSIPVDGILRIGSLSRCGTQTVNFSLQGEVPLQTQLALQE